MYINLNVPFDDKFKELKQIKKSDLIDHIVDIYYNEFLSAYSDFKDNEVDIHYCGKRIPYIGWFWRSVNFSKKNITIGDCGDFIGFMENNKWGYNQRTLTEDEFNVVISLIDEAISINSMGGSVSDIIKKRDEKLNDLWNYFQGLKI